MEVFFHKSSRRRQAGRQKTPSGSGSWSWKSGDSYTSWNTGTSKSAYRPKSVVSRAQRNSSILDRIKDKPLRSSARQTNRKFPAVGAAGNTGAAKKRSVASSFSMPLLPVLGFIVLGIFFVVDNRDSISSMIHQDMIPAPSADSGGSTSMAAMVDDNGAGIRQISLISESGETIRTAAEVPAAAGPAVPVTTPAELDAPAVSAAPEEAGSAVPKDTVMNTPAQAAAPVESAPAVKVVPASASIPGSPRIELQSELKEEPIPLKMVEYFAWIPYTVKKDETLSSIAGAHGLSIGAVIASNNLPNAHQVRVGQELRLPNMDGIPYTVKKGDNLYTIARTHGVPLEVLADVNNIQRDIIIPGQNIFLPGAKMSANELQSALGTLFIAPLGNAVLSSPFGWRADPFSGKQRLHEAVDLAIAKGTPVIASSGGRVSLVAVSPVYGNYIILDHGNNFQTLYAHLSVCSVKQGDTVAQGIKIGEVGSTGLSTGPHLHFSIYKNGHAVNPLDYYRK